MRKGLITIVLMSLSLSLVGQEYLLVAGKTVRVKGKTSIGKFDCAYEVSAGQDSISFEQMKDQGTVLDIFLPVDEFGCGNKLLTKDFGKTLQSKEHPNIQVIVTDFERQDGEYVGSIELHLVGKELKIDRIPFVSVYKDGIESLFTEISLEITHLGIRPPKRFFGLIKVHDLLSVELYLQLEAH